MTTGIIETLALLDAAEHVTARSCWLDWPSMTQLFDGARSLARASERDPLSAREQAALDQTWALTRSCAEGPVQPADEAVRLQEALADAASVDSRHRPALERIWKAVETVTASEHPAISWLIDLLTTHDPQELPATHPRAGDPAVALLVRPRAEAAVRGWVSDEQLFVDVTTPAASRSAAPWDCAVLFGPPARYTSNWWTRGQVATTRAAWILNAPPALEVVILAWPGHGRIDEEGLRPWAGGPIPPIRHDTTPPPAVAAWQTPPELTSAPPTRAIRHDGPDSVTATGVQVLVGENETVQCYLSTAVGPAPAVASTDAAGLAVRRGTISALRTGTHLVCRLGGTEATALDEATMAWCHDNRPGPWPAKARRFQAELKTHVADRVGHTGYDALIRDLVIAGLRRDYCQHLPARVLHPLYIAPREQQAFDALCRAVKYDAPSDAFATLTIWRTARQQGGLIVRNKLLAGLRGAAGEAAELDDVGYTRLDHPDLGDVVIGTVVGQISEAGQIQISRLGKPLTGSGALWQP